MSEEPYASDSPTIEGQVIEGRYRIVRKIADGGMASVFEAVDERLSRHVALKMMHMQLIQGNHREQFIERFHREARSSASIANPHIVQVYDTGTYQGVGFLVMEYVHGVNLRHEMNQRGTFKVHESLRILSETLDGLASAHAAGVVHRDVKPENIMINSRGHVQLTDFGLAKVASQATLSTTGMLLGTAAYLAPEMIEFNQATMQGDVYACGIIAYEMLTGTVPFVGENPVTVIFKHVHSDIPPLSETCPGIDSAVSAFIARLTSRRVEDRPRNAQEALDELHGLNGLLSLDASQFQMPAQLGHRRTDAPTSKAVHETHPPFPSSQTEGQPPSNHGENIAQTNMTQTHMTPTHMMPNSQDLETRRLTPPDGSDAAGPSEAANLKGTDSKGIGTKGVDPKDVGPKDAARETKTLRPRRRLGLIACIVGILFALGIAGGSAWWYFLGPGSYSSLPAPTDVSCKASQECSVSGASWSRYRSVLKASGIAFTQSEEFSDSVPKGSIISARPETVGAHISKRGGAVSLVISKGVRQATIPTDILDPSTTHGKAPLDALKAAGFSKVMHDEAKDEYSVDIPENAAISIDPEPGTTMDHNAEIEIVLSKGPKPVSMPNIVGATKDSARHQLAEAKLNVTFSEDWSDTVASGKVISSSKEAGAQLHWGDAVSVVISKGPQMVTLPDVRGKNEDDASKILKALGLDVKISAPLGDITQTVRLQSPDPGAQIRIRDTSGNPTVVTLTVV
ncbi:MAG: PASTA domain-containing protein [Bifidobacterium sp.]|uniref:non-specific serine/threonine protein kinase n=2 Tax=Bifidobacterium TaxID=1678 RepID=A0AB39UFP4_9BIFI